jgi:hypothetical protein
MTLGGASVIGTGAFTSVEAERSISVDVVGDESAFLKLSPTCKDGEGDDGDNEGGDTNGDSSLRSSDFVYTKDDGTIAVDLTDSIDDNDTVSRKIDGAGITEDSLWRFPNAFKIANQGTQAVAVDFEVRDKDGEIEISSGGNAKVGGKVREYNEDDNPAVVFYPGSNDALGNLFNDEENGLVLGPSDDQCIGFNVRTFGFGGSDDPFKNANLRITADATEVDEVENQPRAGLGISLSEIDGQSAGGKFNITGNVENNSSDGVGDITVELEILNGNGVKVNPNGNNDKLIEDVSPGSDLGFKFEDITLDNSGSYTARVTATADGDNIKVAPVSDSTDFNIGIVSVENKQTYGQGNSRVRFELSARDDVTIKELKIVSASNNPGQGGKDNIDVIACEGGPTIESGSGNDGFNSENHTGLFATGAQVDLNSPIGVSSGDGETVLIGIGEFRATSGESPNSNRKSMNNGSAEIIFYHKTGDDETVKLTDIPNK